MSGEKIHPADFSREIWNTERASEALGMIIDYYKHPSRALMLLRQELLAIGKDHRSKLIGGPEVLTFYLDKHYSSDSNVFVLLPQNRFQGAPVLAHRHPIRQRNWPENALWFLHRDFLHIRDSMFTSFRVMDAFDEGETRKKIHRQASMHVSTRDAVTIKLREGDLHDHAIAGQRDHELIFDIPVRYLWNREWVSYGHSYKLWETRHVAVPGAWLNWKVMMIEEVPLKLIDELPTAAATAAEAAA